MYAISEQTFDVFEQQRERMLTRLKALGEMPMGKANLTDAIKLMDADRDSFPWVDLWLPAVLSSIFVLPQLVEQQLKQGETKLSVRFQNKCMKKGS